MVEERAAGILRRMFSRLPRVPTTCALLALASTPLIGQDRREPPRRNPPAAYPDRGSEDELPPEDPADTMADPANAFELALSDDGLWFGYRSGLHRGKGYFSVEFFGDQESNYLLDAGLMRWSEPSVATPFAFGVGLGAFGAITDETDSELLAITLTGAADFELDEYLVLSYPTRIGVELTYAPDVATFLDGQRVLDALGRIEIDLSPWATGYAGYRHVETDIEDEDDFEFDSAFQAGVRLAF
jgi:hypothetical protein